MDSGDGRLNPVTEAFANKLLDRDDPDCCGVFRIGEKLCIRGSNFRIKSIKPTELRLKLLPR